MMKEEMNEFEREQKEVKDLTERIQEITSQEESLNVLKRVEQLESELYYKSKLAHIQLKNAISKVDYVLGMYK